MEDLEITTSVTGQTMVMYEQEKAQIDSMVATANAFPRNLRRVTENAIAVVTMSQEGAATCSYSVPRGGKPITGPSVHLARVLVQQYKNLRVEARVVDVDAKHVTAEAVCYDIENNTAVRVQVKRSIVGKLGRFNEDMITVTGNAACAIAYRNAVLSVIPKSITDLVYKAAMQTVTGDVSDKNKLIARRKQIVDGLKDTFSVSEPEILKSVGKASLDHIGQEEIMVLIGFGQAIKDGDTTIESVFKGVKDGGDKAYDSLFDAADKKDKKDKNKEG